MAKSTPWGAAQTSKTIAEGIVSYMTASHGGILISDQRRESMPDHLRSIPTFAGGNWYEEDCDWAIVALAFPVHFPKDQDAAKSTLEWLKANSKRFA